MTSSYTALSIFALLQIRTKRAIQKTGNQYLVLRFPREVVIVEPAR
jgi:hypothetical protein